MVDQTIKAGFPRPGRDHELAAPPPPANGTAGPIPSSDPIYRAQYLNLSICARTAELLWPVL